MGLVTEIAKRPWARAAVSRIGAGYIRFVRASGTWRVENQETPQAFWDRREPFIGAFWHARLLMMPTNWRRDVKMNMLIAARGADTELIVDIIAHFDQASIRGSALHGGHDATRDMIRVLRQGEYTAITPDGPHGPPMRAKRGIIDLARLAQVPILPTSYGARPRRRMRGWDRTVIPYPFGRGVITWGAPIHVPRDADEDTIEAKRRDLEQNLIRLTVEADRLCGVADADEEAMLQESPEGAGGGTT
jgi:lysophospholipid acyltransferase (LPLAT)-like uncharacterized protein